MGQQLKFFNIFCQNFQKLEHQKIKYRYEKH